VAAPRRRGLHWWWSFAFIHTHGGLHDPDSLESSASSSHDNTPADPLS
jgi:hypothetical protein